MPTDINKFLMGYQLCLLVEVTGVSGIISASIIRATIAMTA
jgi:hypothetical protein